MTIIHKIEMVTNNFTIEEIGIWAYSAYFNK